MGTRERREREREQLRTKILDAARELFAREGYDAVSMRKIADAIEYSPTAIYVHFKDKAELMRELCRADFGRINAANPGALEVSDPVERMRQLGLHYMRFAISHPNHFRLMFMTKPAPEMSLSEEQMRSEGKGDPNTDGYALLRMTVEEAMKQDRILPHLNDADLVTQLLWAGVHGVASLHITQPDDHSWCGWLGADTLGEQMVDLVLRGVLRPDDPALAKKQKGGKRA
jgi:AcrR family transcriptional regulator